MCKLGQKYCNFPTVEEGQIIYLWNIHFHLFYSVIVFQYMAITVIGIII